MAYALLGEVLEPLQSLGAGLVILSILILQIRTASKEEIGPRI
jgi:drug/metabolite transporter (DMT)-like permease